jgi:hypothetical protein
MRDKDTARAHKHQDRQTNSSYTAGTNPLHNKKKKAAPKELDDDDLAHKAKLAAG